MTGRERPAILCKLLQAKDLQAFTSRRPGLRTKIKQTIEQANGSKAPYLYGLISPDL